jgi:phosphoesterase RecJ-like protein
MLPAAYEKYLGNIALRIDHHGSATSFTEHELVQPEAGACGEIIYDLLMELWQDLDRETADAMYVAISTDTGCFRFSNTTDHTFLVAAACKRAGARVYEINQEIFETVRFTKLKMHSWIVENMKLYRDGKFALVAIPKAVEGAIGVTEDDMENISNFPRNIAGVCVAATVRETKDGKSKLSVRATPQYDAAAVCEKFGGGGHRGAAGASISLPIEEAAKAVEKAMLEL